MAYYLTTANIHVPPATSTVATAGTGNGLAVTDGTNVPAGNFSANKVFNAVWNDVADFQLLNDKFIPGKCYVDHIEGARIASQRCQMGVIGIASDTFGYGVGSGANESEVPIAIAGWVLAFVDQEYPCGTPLTCNENGELTEMSLEEKRDYPERIVGIYKKPERNKEFGPNKNKILVNGRHWVKVK
ncbi:MAG: hypothetical protein A2504_06935 [Bdellovibrionales bacterium RIFOXYD12_FULL_39_22]|nr:MAG: hypothetical protein A2385_05150 [Bdellovibrionales bacterium RIFOXYB1_FULL_39_21]OFZ44309.1 MAG: hypothetical protein A2485_15930 [Bdellovibrionales bacterium RIFOXYC12_FULL_39_17]OFZ49164.1 MAG: hypothetical protein A2404_15870 [Bdellovibrionales bacterium RIFOXYC1_FULL_39_130]OFZ72240.1 MAG: hypothetical protein A2451_15775 [Bdellovibrionales bacterium RIFOXYC2_FULL_39_8]OFZ76972.1 MAG: hypothetical protein A2560_10955 [Bdellovibrionales bacterium RIFOXYD1_FULL_39_84]OFZ95185.1 MAG: